MALNPTNRWAGALGQLLMSAGQQIPAMALQRQETEREDEYKKLNMHMQLLGMQEQRTQNQRSYDLQNRQYQQSYDLQNRQYQQSYDLQNRQFEYTKERDEADRIASLQETMAKLKADWERMNQEQSFDRWKFGRTTGGVVDKLLQTFRDSRYVYPTFAFDEKGKPVYTSGYHPKFTPETYDTLNYIIQKGMMPTSGTMLERPPVPLSPKGWTGKRNISVPKQPDIETWGKNRYEDWDDLTKEEKQLIYRNHMGRNVIY